MNKKTKKQRLEIYKKMLKWFEVGDYGCSEPCFCASILYVTNDKTYLEQYPELMKNQPHSHGIFWFDIYEKGIEKRKQILRKIIKEMS